MIKSQYEKSALDKKLDKKLGYKEGSKADERIDRKAMQLISKSRSKKSGMELLKKALKIK